MSVGGENWELERRADDNDNVYGHYLRWFHSDILKGVVSLTAIKKKGPRQNKSPFSASTICILYIVVGIHVDWGQGMKILSIPREKDVSTNTNEKTAFI